MKIRNFSNKNLNENSNKKLEIFKNDELFIIKNNVNQNNKTPQATNKSNKINKNDNINILKNSFEKITEENEEITTYLKNSSDKKNKGISLLFKCV